MEAQIDSIFVKDIESDSIYKVAMIDLVVDSKPKLDTIYWDKRNIVTFDVSEVAFVNWNAGGTNSVAGLLGVELIRNYKKGNLLWESRGVAKFGMNRREDSGLRKTDDLIKITSTIGYRKDTLSNWYSSANMSFETQFAKGYNYKNDTKTLVSDFMAPAYMFVGAGTVYGKDVDQLALYLSPVTFKATFVLNQELANLGSFGVTPAEYDDEGNLIKEGDNAIIGFGILVRSRFEKEITKNIFLRNYLSLYTDYLNNFGNIDVDWEIVANFKVNNYIRAVLGSHVKFDDDVKFYETLDDGTTISSGAKVQWKQILGIGVIFDF